MKDLAQRAVVESPARDHGIKQARQALLKALDQCPRAMTSPGSARLARISSGMHRQCVHGSGGGRGQEQAARGQGPGRACEAAARGQAAHLPSSLRQQAGREGPQETPSPCCATLQELHGEGVLSRAP